MPLPSDYRSELIDYGESPDVDPFAGLFPDPRESRSLARQVDDLSRRVEELERRLEERGQPTRSELLDLLAESEEAKAIRERMGRR